MRGRGAALLLVLAASACGRPKEPPLPFVPHPTGSGVWFSEGFGSVQDQAAVEAAISGAGLPWVLLPAARVERRGGFWVVVKRAPPPRPFARGPVSLVIDGDEEVRVALAAPDAEARRSLENALGTAVEAVLRDAARYGPVTGIHLDLDFTAATAAPYAELLRRVRSRMPRRSFLSATLRIDPPAGDREKLRVVASSVNGLVAMVFGEDDRANPDTADTFGRPWWSGYSPSARGRWTGARGEGPLPESFLAKLSDDAGLEFRHDMEVEEKAGLGYLFRVRRALTFAGLGFSPGDEIVFHQPSLEEMVRRFAADREGSRYSRGRVVRFTGKSDSERIFTFAALNEILLGRSLAPDLRVAVDHRGGSVAVSAENLSPLPSILSRTTNWVEVDLGKPGVRDVRPGGFDRYEVYAANGRPVSLGRAQRVRFYETLIGPHERIAPALIVTHRPSPAGCCRHRTHVLSAAGPEVSIDWRHPAAAPGAETPAVSPGGQPKKSRP